MKKINIPIIWCLILSTPLYSFAKESKADLATPEKTLPLNNYENEIRLDLSTPEKTIKNFYDAFKLGNDAILEQVLAKDASIPEFNPIQKILCPSPEIVGFEVKKSRVIQDKDQGTSQTIAGDVEIHILLKIDKLLRQSKENKCNATNSLNIKSVYYLRKIDNNWRIVSALPFWTDNVQKLGGKIILPDGWRYPTEVDIINSWAKYRSILPVPYHISADFNDDFVMDDIWVLINEKNGSFGIFGFLKSTYAKTRIFKIYENKDYKPQQIGILYIVPKQLNNTSCGLGLSRCSREDFESLETGIPVFEIFIFDNYFKDFYYWNESLGSFEVESIED